MSRRTLLLVSLSLPLSLLAACSDDDTGSAPSARLLTMADCGAVKDYMKTVAIEQMNRRIDDELAAYIRGERCYRGYGEDDSVGQPSPGSGTGGGSGGNSGPTTGTGTNNQVAGVDEADFIKNDGQYIYLAQNGVFRIVDSWPADLTHEVSATPVEGEPKKLFVLGDKALVYVATGSANNGYYNRECTYGYTCDFTGDGTGTKLLVFNISDRTAPVLEREVSLSGSLIAGRRVGTAVHTVVTQAANPFPSLDYNPDEELCNYQGAKPTAYNVLLAKQAYDRLRATNRETIMATDLEQKLPTLADSAGLTPDGEAASCESLYASSINDGSAFTSIVSVDLTHPGPVKTSTIVSAPGAIYASEDALYMAVPHRWTSGGWGGYDTTDSVSTVHKFRISEIAGQTKYLASGLINGRVLNQFAMDEKDHLLRIASTDGHVPNPETNSYLTVLEEQHDELVAIGKIGGIAPDEDIRSVRFDGNHAFVVTFKKTDPLFAFDLSDPTDPEMVGELQIPGFSTYMHLIDSTHLLTIGYDADDHGDFAFFDGIQLQIFDVSNMASPQLASRYLIGTRGSSSEALTNHLAFTWYPEKGLLSLPMTICEGGGDGTYGTNMTFSGLMVFDASIASGFSEHGRVPHTVSPDATCSNWWTNASSAVKRSLFLDNFVYSVSDSELRVRDVNAMSTELVTLDLTP
ncbi:MAG TPA: beta-propeller domain-containing protein [Kofleriaceae bacterium]|nr:beta-propeller domain-containing protein [Kofleriaceae bacterium]